MEDAVEEMKYDTKKAPDSTPFFITLLDLWNALISLYTLHAPSLLCRIWSNWSVTWSQWKMPSWRWNMMQRKLLLVFNLHTEISVLYLLENKLLSSNKLPWKIIVYGPWSHFLLKNKHLLNFWVLKGEPFLWVYSNPSYFSSHGLYKYTVSSYWMKMPVCRTSRRPVPHTVITFDFWLCHLDPWATTF